VGSFLKQAEAAYQKRKSEVREGKFSPGKIRQRVVLFAEIARDFLAHSKQTKRSYGHDVSRLGHKTVVTTMRYAHLAPRDLADTAELLVGPTSTAPNTN